MPSTTPDHTWNFFRTGGFDQVRIDNGDDLLALKNLNQKLWAALACPTTGLEFDERTLRAIDTDHDGRIRAPEMLAAIDWARGRLRSLDSLFSGADAMPLHDIDESNPEGASVAAAARQILASLGRADDSTISASDTGDLARLFADTAFNGDGIVPAEAASDDDTRALIENILACTTPATDRSGKPGVDRASVESFFDAAQAYADWWASAEAEGVLSLGEQTAAGADAVAAVAAKIEDYFARCRLAAFDPRAIDALNREESEYLAVAARDMSITPDEVAGLPLARVEGGRPLPLGAGINPAWTAPMAAFVSAAVTPVLGEVADLTEAGWTEVRGRFAAFEAWRGGKAGSSVESLGLDRVREILGSEGRVAVEGLLDEDESLKDEFDAIESVDKLVLLHRDLVTLTRNFVNLEQFYDPEQRAIFQAGTLYLDTRSCDLCIKVADAGKHATLAPLSQAYLAYTTCVRKSTGQTMTIVAAFTGGDTDNLMVGRNGVFYDRDGNDWDATIAKIVENPISIRQAFWSPYKKVLRSIESAIAKRAAAADAAADNKLAAGAAGAGKAAGGAPAPVAKPKIDVGMVAALGVAVGGLVAALGAILSVFFGLGLWMPLGFVGLMLVISGPSMLIAALKLRQRNLGPLLDANGWAVNAMARINIPFGGSLTQVASLPEGSKRNVKDPFAQSSKGLRLAAALLLIGLLGGTWYMGALDSALPDALDRSSLLGDTGPADADGSPQG